MTSFQSSDPSCLYNSRGQKKTIPSTSVRSEVIRSVLAKKKVTKMIVFPSEEGLQGFS